MFADIFTVLTLVHLDGESGKFKKQLILQKIKSNLRIFRYMFFVTKSLYTNMRNLSMLRTWM